MSYIAHVTQEVIGNTNFRKVLYTGAKSQLVVMTIPPGGEIGAETHAHVEQTLFIASGSGKTVMNGAETPIVSGDVVVVTPGTLHNVVNTGSDDLKICTVYAPANHLDGTVHPTKADADADTADEAFGQEVR